MPNRLADETSPYLRQHADNPVDWYPWGDEAFAAARERDVPVMLSVGYSACHWCHVMAHESFEDPATAELMNRHFVNVKVDREERPDVDAIYMDAVQAMSGHGGWPMTVFLTPDGRPFFGGTYFPRTSRGSMISFTELLGRIDEVWRTRRADLEAQADELTDAVGRTLEPGASGPGALPGADVLDAAVQRLLTQFDPAWGGFGNAPKFPHTMAIDLLLRAYQRSGDEGVLDAVTTSLDAMAAGGMYDHLGGGFARYSVDEEWLVPHFEKMLYDQALLTRSYLHAALVLGRADHRQVVEETIGYVLRDLRHPDGGFYSAEDADSEGEEGRFYVWSLDELRSVASEAGADPDEVAAWYGATRAGNFEGHNILHRPSRPVDGGRRRSWGPLARPDGVERARAAMFERRAGRVRPGLDDKVLTEWNGLMLSALVEAAGAFERDDWLAEAERTGDFLLSSLRREDGRWLRSWQGGDPGQPGRAQHLAYAADHGALLDAFTRLAEVSGRARWLDEARQVADALLDRFWDGDRGGVFTTGDDAPALVTRPKDLMDNATPSANSLAANGLLRLAALTGEPRYEDRALDILQLLAGPAATHPVALAHLLAAVGLHAGGITEVVITGERPDLVRVVTEGFRPSVVLAWGERTSSPLWEGRSETGADGRAYVCRSYVCDAPVTTPDALRAALTT